MGGTLCSSIKDEVDFYIFESPSITQIEAQEMCKLIH